jgi:hypothetical protein
MAIAEPRHSGIRMRFHGLLRRLARLRAFAKNVPAFNSLMAFPSDPGFLFVVPTEVVSLNELPNVRVERPR